MLVAAIYYEYFFHNIVLQTHACRMCNLLVLSKGIRNMCFSKP